MKDIAFRGLVQFFVNGLKLGCGLGFILRIDGGHKILDGLLKVRANILIVQIMRPVSS